MSSGSAREHWEQQADAWIALTGSDPDYELLNKPSFLTLLPEAGHLTVDAGCGEGRLARELIALGHRVVGFDGSNGLAGAARCARPALPVGVADVATLPVWSGAADLVVSFMVLMDVEDLDAVVAEFARVLCVGGVLCVAILHPIFTSGLFVPGDEHQTFYMGAYAQSMRHILDIERYTGERFVFRIEHRPLERYSRALEASDLELTHVREPLPSDDAVSGKPDFAKFQRVPEFLHLRAVKHA